MVVVVAATDLGAVVGLVATGLGAIDLATGLKGFQKTCVGVITMDFFVI